MYNFKKSLLSTAKPLLLWPRCEIHLLNTRWPHWYKYVFSGTLTVRESSVAKPKFLSLEKTQTAHCTDTLNTVICISLPPQQPGARSQASELKETSLTSSEKTSCPLHSAPVNLAKENSGWFFTSPHVTAMVLLSAGGKLQVSHCVKGNESQDGGFPCVTGTCHGCSVCLG